MSDVGSRAEQQAQAAGDETLRDAGEELMRMALAELPKGDPAEDPDPAVALAELGYIREVHPGVIAVGFRGPYAAKLHEAKHYNHPRGGKAKFLEDPLKALIPHLQGIAAGKLRARFKART